MTGRKKEVVDISTWLPFPILLRVGWQLEKKMFEVRMAGAHEREGQLTAKKHLPATAEPISSQQS